MNRASQKPGLKAAALAAPEHPAPAGVVTVTTPLSAADRENPAKLSGEALRKLAHQRGVSRSEAAGMSDERLRVQLLYITNRQYAEA